MNASSAGVRSASAANCRVVESWILDDPQVRLLLLRRGACLHEVMLGQPDTRPSHRPGDEREVSRHDTRWRGAEPTCVAAA